MTEAEAIQAWSERLRGWSVRCYRSHLGGEGRLYWRGKSKDHAIERSGFVELIEALLAWEADHA